MHPDMIWNLCHIYFIFLSSFNKPLHLRMNFSFVVRDTIYVFGIIIVTCGLGRHRAFFKTKIKSPKSALDMIWRW